MTRPSGASARRWVAMGGRGVETVAAAMSWTLALLLQHPAVLADVVDEARGFMPGPDGSVPALPRLSACIDEALRLFPPAHSVGRRAIADVDVGGFFVPQGSVVLLSLVAMHRRADLWPEPARFDPDRFVTTPRPAGYLPFGVGLRGCIGHHMALLEARVCLAVFLQRVAWTPTSTTLPPCDTVITIRPRGGLWVHGRRRAVEG